MPLLSTPEALHVTDSFLLSLYGKSTFVRWKELKEELGFSTEREYVTWLIDVANHYKQSESGEVSGDRVADSNIANIKAEVRLDGNDTPVKDMGACGYVESVSGSDYTTDTSTNGNRIASADRIGVSTSTTKYVKEESVQQQPDIDRQSHSEQPGTSHEDVAGQSQQDTEEYYEDYYTTYKQEASMIVQMDSEEIILSSDNDDEGETGNFYEHSREADDAMDPSTRADCEHSVYNQCDETNDVSKALKKFACPYCSYSSHHGNGLVRRHIAAVHEHRKPYFCDYCNQQFALKNQLKSHLICKHGFSSKYVCKVCGKYFPWQKNLEKHKCKKVMHVNT